MTTANALETAWLETIIDGVDDAVRVVDTKGCLIFSNQAARDLFGDAVDLNIFLPDQVKPCAANQLPLTRALRGQTVEKEEFLVCTPRIPEGIWMDVCARPLRGPDGKQLGALSVWHDITQLKQAEIELRERNQVYDALFNRVADAVFVFDKETHKFLHCNETAVRIYGYTRDELLEMRPFDLHPTEEFAEVGEKIDEHNRDEANSYTHVTKHGVPREVEILSDEIEYDGRPAWISVVHDITERRQIEREWRNAKEAAEAANKAKGDFLANMSHEIRTPLNGIVGMTHLLLDVDLAQEPRAYVKTIQGCSESLLSIINDVLDFSKIEARKLDFETIDFDLRCTIEDLMDLLAHRADAKGLELMMQLQPDAPVKLRGDPGRLRQILVNLTNNAIKFTQSGQIVLHAAVESETESHVVMAFRVVDTGIGIEKKDLGSLFEPFSQVDSSITREFGGTGLGLAISRQLIELMDGSIGVESTPGEGSTFHFTAKFEKQEGNRELPMNRDIRNLRILVVDDNQTNREIIEAQLSAWGCRPRLAVDGEAGEHELRRAASIGAPYDLAILDYQMPGLDGLTLGRRVHADAALKETILVALTSIGQRGDAKRFKRAGFAAYLNKPIRPSSLYDCIATVTGAPDTGTTDESVELVTRHTLAENRRRRRVLVVEDNPVNRQVAVSLVKRMGHHVGTANNGIEALDALARDRFDVVLMDCQMPEMDGYQATKEIRKLEGETAGIPIIAMTAHAMVGEREKCLAAGMNDYLSKPIDLGALTSKIEQWTADPAPAES